MKRWPLNFLIDCDVDTWGRNFNREFFLQLKDIDDFMARTGRIMTRHDMNVTLCVHRIKKNWKGNSVLILYCTVHCIAFLCTVFGIQN